MIAGKKVLTVMAVIGSFLLGSFVTYIGLQKDTDTTVLDNEQVTVETVADINTVVTNDSEFSVTVDLPGNKTDFTAYDISVNGSKAVIDFMAE